MKNKILIVEDDEILLSTLKIFLEGKNYEVLFASDGESALKIFEKQPVLLVITDLQMPIMDGVALVDNLMTYPNKPVILIHSSASDLNQIIELMQKGVYDYLIKPFNFAEIGLRVNKAYEFAELRHIKSQVEKERELRTSHLLHWKNENENILSKKTEPIDGNLIGSIRTSFSQGAGLGALISISELIRKKAVEKEKSFEISKPLLNLFFDNIEVARKVINSLEEIESIQSGTMNFEICSIKDIYEILTNVSQNINELKKLKNHEISLPSNQFLNSPQKIKISKSNFEKAISEILFNALKFSEPNSTIYILLDLQETKIFISILNTPSKDGVTAMGILPEYSNIIFEPFFRISKLVYESIPTLDFGLGLTLVDKVIRSHNGKVKAMNLSRFPNSKEGELDRNLVNFEIELPLINSP